jgi:hypothetical protein
MFHLFRYENFLRLVFQLPHFILYFKTKVCFFSTIYFYSFKFSEVIN